MAWPRLHHLPLLVLMAVLGGCAALPASDEGRFVARSIEFDGVRMPYQVFVPATSARAPGALPVVLFLHGSGERGDDGRRQTEAGLGPYLRAHAGDFPALVVLPQVARGGEWSGRNARLAVAALDAAMREFDADPRRQDLTGAVRPPRAERPGLRVEAVAAESDPYQAMALRLKDTPVWIFHGARDDVVRPDDDRRLHAAFQAVAARDARYTEYPQGNHNAWDATYADPAMWRWLFAQER